MLLPLLPDLNVAPLKYAHVQTEHGGPIRSLSCQECDLPNGKIWEGSACLEEAKLRLKSPLPAGPHGTGLALHKPDALHTAISKALETWAWLAIKQDQALAATLRFDLDPSSHGFAAFPGLGVQGAKKRAYFEAAEKWALCAWWEGQLPHSELGPNSIQIIPPIPGVCVVILWITLKDQTFYGVGTSHGPTTAMAKASLSLQRNRDILKKPPTPSGIAEQRLRFFASSLGLNTFRKRLELAVKKSAITPALAVDLAVLGPWHQYAHVWRCLYDCSGFREKNKEDYFLP